jgi:hypothetical protein
MAAVRVETAAVRRDAARQREQEHERCDPHRSSAPASGAPAFEKLLRTIGSRQSPRGAREVRGAAPVPRDGAACSTRRAPAVTGRPRSTSTR